MTNSLCLYCKSPIAWDARKCPSCGCWQSKWGNGAASPGSQLVSAVCLAIVLGGLVWLIYGAHSVDDRVQDPVAALEVVESDWSLVQGSRGVYVSVVGRLRNSASMTWRDVYFHAEFSDDSGHLVDVISDRHWDLVVPAQGETSFRIYAPAGSPEESYSSLDVVIRDASSGRS